MHSLSNLKDTRPSVKIQRIGRGVGSGRGKTSTRGQKGDGSRSGYKRRHGYEGGQVPLYRKLPVRGFTRGRFIQIHAAINLKRIEQHYNDGEVVNETTLREKGLIGRKVPGGIKILSNGELTKKVTIEAHAFSEAAKKKLEEKAIKFSVISQ